MINVHNQKKAMKHCNKHIYYGTFSPPCIKFTSYFINFGLERYVCRKVNRETSLCVQHCVSAASRYAQYRSDTRKEGDEFGKESESQSQSSWFTHSEHILTAMKRLQLFSFRKTNRLCSKEFELLRKERN